MAISRGIFGCRGNLWLGSGGPVAIRLASLPCFAKDASEKGICRNTFFRSVLCGDAGAGERNAWPIWVTPASPFTSSPVTATLSHPRLVREYCSSSQRPHIHHILWRQLPGLSLGWWGHYSCVRLRTAIVAHYSPSGGRIGQHLPCKLGHCLVWYLQTAGGTPALVR